jgi:TolA-binding protein
MSPERKQSSNRVLAASLVVLFLALAPGCSVNRHVVSMQTQVHVLNNDLALRQRHMNSELEVMTQLVQHNAATLRAVTDRVERMRQEVTTRSEQERLAKLIRQLKHLRESAREMNATMAEMEARASELKDLQYAMIRSAVPNPQTDTDTANVERE